MKKKLLIILTFFKTSNNRKRQSFVVNGSKLGNFIWNDRILRVNLYQARNLLALDDNGLCDPYVVVKYCGTSIKFPTKKKTLNPNWYCSLSANTKIASPAELAPSIHIAVFDYDRVGKDDPIGRFSISLFDVLLMCNNEEIKPKWFQLYDWNNQKIDKAEILMSFDLFEVNNMMKLNETINLLPETTPMKLQVISLGLRNLQSTIGIHKTYLHFNLPGDAHFQTKKSKLPNAENPNFLQILEIPIDLAKKKIYAAALNLQVRDVLFGGIIDRLIGAGTLNLAQFLIDDPNDSELWIKPRTKNFNFATDKNVNQSLLAKKEEHLSSLIVHAKEQAELQFIRYKTQQEQRILNSLDTRDFNGLSDSDALAKAKNHLVINEHDLHHEYLSQSTSSDQVIINIEAGKGDNYEDYDHKFEETQSLLGGGKNKAGFSTSKVQKEGSEGPERRRRRRFIYT